MNRLQNKKETVDHLSKVAHRISTELLESLKQEVRELKPEDSTATTIITASDICHLSASYIDKTLLEAVKSISQFSASSVEQILRIVESFLIENDNGTTKLSQEDVVKRISFISYVSVMLTDELSNVSSAFVDTARSLGAEAQSHFSQFGKRGEPELVESKKCTEDIDTKVNLHINHIYLDTSSAISNIEECRKFLYPICKYLVSTSLQLPKE